MNDEDCEWVDRIVRLVPLLNLYIVSSSYSKYSKTRSPIRFIRLWLFSSEDSTFLLKSSPAPFILCLVHPATLMAVFSWWITSRFTSELLTSKTRLSILEACVHHDETTALWWSRYLSLLLINPHYINYLTFDLTMGCSLSRTNVPM